MTTHHPRTNPIILLTGTPGTGKSTHAQLLVSSSSSSTSNSTSNSTSAAATATATATGTTAGQGDEQGACEFEHINVSELVKEMGFHEGWDEEWSSWVLDEDKLLDHLEPILNPASGPSPKGFILEHHSPSLFPERWIDLVVVLGCDNEVLWERLEARGYPEKKIRENITAEILQTILVEAQESYAPELVVELRSEGKVDGEMEGNVERVLQWVEGWKRDGAGEGHVLRGGERQGEEDGEEDEMED